MEQIGIRRSEKWNEVKSSSGWSFVQSPPRPGRNWSFSGNDVHLRFVEKWQKGGEFILLVKDCPSRPSKCFLAPDLECSLSS